MLLRSSKRITYPKSQTTRIGFLTRNTRKDGKTEKYIVRLSDEERQELEKIVKKLKGTSQKVNRALALLHADANGPDWTNDQIAARTGLTVRAITNIRSNISAKFFLSFFV